jgi:hypothetical protein
MPRVITGSGFPNFGWFNKYRMGIPGRGIPCHASDAPKEVDMGNILWTIIVILFVLWLIGLVAHIGGGLIHLLLVIAVIMLVINLITGRKTV